MITILHNPRCSKSREALQILQESWAEYKIREYLKDPLNYQELTTLQKKLWLNVIDFMRTKEPDFKEASLNKKSWDEELLQAIAKHPKLLERPITIKWEEAVLCWPPSNIQKFI